MKLFKKWFYEIKSCVFFEYDKNKNKMIKIKYSDGEKYEGEIWNQMRNGIGKYFYKDGNIYEGEWLNDEKNGKGKLYYHNGDYYIGNFLKNEKDGYGEYFYYNKKNYYKGYWTKNQKNGKGVIIFKNNKFLLGTFLKNKKLGIFLKNDENNNYFIENWKLNELIDSFKIEKPKNLDINNLINYDLSNIEEFKKIKTQSSNLLGQRTTTGTFSNLGLDTLSLIDYKEKLKINDINFDNKEIREWDFHDIENFLKSINLEEFIPTFINNKINGDSFIRMKEDDFISLGINKKGTLIILLDSIEKLKKLSKIEIRKKLMIKNKLIPNIKNKNADKLISYFEKYGNNRIVEKSNETSSYNKSINEQATLKQNELFEKKIKKKHKKIKSFEINNSSSKSSHSAQTEVSSISDETISNENENSQLFPFSSPKYYKANLEFINYEKLKFLEQINEGAFGRIYKGVYENQIVALKKYKNLNKYFNIDIFMKEVKILSDMRHPNIWLLKGISINQNNHIIVTEYLENGSLFEHIHKKKKKFDYKRILDIIEDILQGLAYLHNKEFIHCDIKSSNILVDLKWKIKIADFGLSRIKNKIKFKTGRVGTINWMAPEVMRGDTYDEKSDIYSFGIILWELIAKKIPFEDLTLNQINGIINHSDDNFIPLEPPEYFDQNLIKMIYDCIKKDPKKRPTSYELLEKIIELKKLNNL